VLSFCGFLIAYRFRNSRVILVSTAPGLLAFFYKQAFVGATLGVFVYLILQRRYKLAAQFAGLFATGLVIVVALCQFLLFRHQAFLLHAVAYNMLPFRRHEIDYGLLMFFFLLGIPVAGAIFFLLRRRDELVACYLACCTLIPLIAIGRAGSWVNYFVECSIVLFTLLACEVTRKDRTVLRSVVWLVLLAIALWLNHPLAKRSPSPADFARDKALQLFLREHFPPETPGLGYYTGDLIRAGLDTPNTNLWHYVQLVRKGTLSGNEFLEEIEGRKVRVILLDFDQKPNRDDAIANFTLTADFRAAILNNYFLLDVLPMPPLEKHDGNEGQVFVWVPRTDMPAPRPSCALGGG
jgi:hypothetical protein